MIPYVPQPLWRVGPFTIHAFGVTSSAALLLFYWLVVSRAKRYGITNDRAGRLFVGSGLTGLAAGLLWMGGKSVSSTGAAVGGLTGFLFLSRGLPLRPSLDWGAYAFAFFYATARFGCFLAHDHPGPLTTSWIGVQYPGGTRFDLGLLYFLGALVTAAGVFVIDRLALRPGLVFAWMATTLGLARLAILPLAQPGVVDWIVAAGVTAAGIAAVILRRID